MRLRRRESSLFLSSLSHTELANKLLKSVVRARKRLEPTVSQGLWLTNISLSLSQSPWHTFAKAFDKPVPLSLSLSLSLLCVCVVARECCGAYARNYMLHAKKVGFEPCTFGGGGICGCAYSPKSRTAVTDMRMAPTGPTRRSIKMGKASIAAALAMSSVTKSK